MPEAPETPVASETTSRPTKSLLTKFVQTLLLVSGLIGVSTLVIVGVMSAQASAEHLRSVQQYIEEGIASKGKVLTQNHALALRGLTLDNAFLDMQRLVERAIKDDTDLVYGVYVSAERETLALGRRPLPATETSPERDAWRALGLGEGELGVKGLKIQRQQRFGQDLLEVAAPVFGEEGEILGTVRYGLSTHRMHDAIARAKAESSARLTRSYTLIGGLVSLTLLVGLWLSRSQAVRITRPIDDLTLAARMLAAGDHGVRVSINSHDELEVLGASFNRMVEDLGASYKNLAEMNQTLEQKVHDRTLELAHKNRDMRLVLDNVDQGFVTLSPDGTMAVERSRQVDTWFGEGSGKQALWQYLARTSEAFAESLELSWSQIADDFLPLNVCIAQLPERLTHAGRTWSFRYLPFFRQEQLEGVLVAISDITARLEREREDAEHAELMHAFKGVVQDRAGFETFLTESSELVAQIASRKLESDPVLLKRALHTLKGTAASMGLTLVSQLCHALETQLGEDGVVSDELIGKLERRWSAMLDHLASSGMRSQRLIEIPEQEYAELVAFAADATTSRRELGQKLATWQAEPVEKPFRRLAEQAVGLARRFGKGDLRVVVDAGDVRLDRARFGAFYSELVHVVRNAVDHGIESPAERARAGKPEQGKLTLRAALDGNLVRFEIEDDGAGIDWDAIREIAARRGLPHRTQNELLDALCHDGLTTRSEVTTLSGRGVGMAAFRQRVLTLHGELEVRSERGKSTRWVVRLPLTDATATRGGSGLQGARATPKLSLLESAGGRK
jgi:two-component system chemotaxis sensor kinase CheA